MVDVKLGDMTFEGVDSVKLNTTDNGEVVFTLGNNNQQLWKVTSFDVTFDGDTTDKVIVEDWLVKVSDEPLELFRVVAVEGIGYVSGDSAEHYRATKEEIEYTPYNDGGYESLYVQTSGAEIQTYAADVLNEDGTVRIPAGTYVSCWGEDDYVTRIVSNEALEPVEPYGLTVHEETLTRAKAYTDKRFGEELWQSEDRAVERAVYSAKKYTDTQIDECHTQIVANQNLIGEVYDELERVRSTASEALSEARNDEIVREYITLEADNGSKFRLRVDNNGQLVVTPAP